MTDDRESHMAKRVREERPFLGVVARCCPWLIATWYALAFPLTQVSAGLPLAQPPVRTSHVTVGFEQSVPASRARAVAREVEWLYGAIGHDLDQFPKRLQIVLYGAHRSFAHALWASQHVRPQTASDDSSAIVRGRLLLGPLPTAYLQHNLAHVYTEWLIDRLTGNRSDSLPANTWLYDGLAEVEAFRYAPSGMQCLAHGMPAFDITTANTARRWLSLRAGPLSDLAYCLAYHRAHRIVARLGWSRVVHVLRQAGWLRGSGRLMAAAG